MMKILSLRRILKSLGMVAVGNSLRWTYTSIAESFSGAWQRNVTTESNESLLTNSAVYACVTGIATDISKLRIKLVKNIDGIWEEITSQSQYLKILRKPNHYQNRIEFVENWILSKLLKGNAYVLKDRNSKGVVTDLYVLDPRLVVPMVAEDGGVYYQIRTDALSGITEENTVPASEMIHDKMPTLWHPLIGVSPLYACALSGSVGNKIQKKAIDFYENRAIPGGVITAPEAIPETAAKRIKEAFTKNYGGQNVGKIAVLGDGMKFELMEMTAEAAQMAEQFKMSVEDIARAFHYPTFKLGGPLPPYAGNVEALTVGYYTDCLQTLIEKLELSLDEGLGIPSGKGTQMDLNGLWRMDTNTLYESNSQAVKGGWMSPDEARYRANYPSVVGGDTPYLQQQNYSLAALAKRDAKDDPFAKSGTTAEPSQSQSSDDRSDGEIEEAFVSAFRGELTSWMNENKRLS
jgi:HK97 family phage portal protein